MEIGERGAPWPCAACGAPIVYPGRGRRRVFCVVCTPPGSSGAAWRAANPERTRRLPSSPRACPECGETFKGRRNKLLCGQRRCREARYRRLHPVAYAAKRARKERRRRERKGSAPAPPPVAPAPPRDVLRRSLDARRAELVQRAELLGVSDGESVAVAFEAVLSEMEWLKRLSRELLVEAKLDAIEKRLARSRAASPAIVPTSE